MKLWIDECLSPTLVEAARERFEAACNEYRELLHASDRVLYGVVAEEGWVFVTNDHSDFLRITEREGLHAGLILLPQRLRVEQPATLAAVLDHFEQHSARAGVPPAAWMTNRVVEYHDSDDSVSAGEWP